MSDPSAPKNPEFVSETLFKRDIFSETHSGHLRGDSGTRVIRRIVTASPLWSRPLAWILARREIRALKAVRGIDGTPTLISTDRDGLLRDWLDGTPIQNARPSEDLWFRDAFRILREMRRRRITHNDLAKPQNWLMRPDGRAAVIDFQLASVHRFRTPLYRIMAYEDFRHLLKQQKAYAPETMTPTGRRILATRSLPSHIWRTSGKRVYEFVTRRLLNWSDGEGTHDRLDREGPTIRAKLEADPRVTGCQLVTFTQVARGIGLYAFVETALDEEAVRALIPDHDVDLVQPVERMPRREDGSIRNDVLTLVALNQIADLEVLLDREPDLVPVLRPIIGSRRNFSDRRELEIRK